MKVSAGLFIVFLSSFSPLSSFAQSLPVGTPVLEEAWRRMQIKGERDANTSFTIRPIYTRDDLEFDSLFNPANSLSKARSNARQLFAKGKGEVRLLPVNFKLQYNTNHPYGWNDGAMIQARGYQHLVSLGVYSKIGPLSVQLQPEMVYAQNKDFSTFPSAHNDFVWKTYYRVLNRIDNPEKYGNGTYSKIFPGQSSIRLNLKKISLGVSTENLWWGPGVRNSLIMSNNAPGFMHLTFNTTAPVISPIGSFEWQVIAGQLQNSNITPADTNRTYNGEKLYQTKRTEDRYVNGMILSWQPKWTKNLHLGFIRLFYLYNSDVQPNIGSYLPIVGKFFKKYTPNEDKAYRDQLTSAYLRLILPKENAELYAEFGRNDHSFNSRDFLVEPEHATAYIVGFKKLFEARKQKDVELFMEFTHLHNSETRLVRWLEGWYTHYQVQHGYTNKGQVVGAGIGPGGNSQIIGLNWVKGIETTGLSFERVVRNNDFYYEAFAPSFNFQNHWVDMSINFNKSLTYKRFIYKADLSIVKSFNYQWQQFKDAYMWHGVLSASYIF